VAPPAPAVPPELFVVVEVAPEPAVPPELVLLPFPPQPGPARRRAAQGTAKNESVRQDWYSMRQR
jgi:hypothetical protein